MPRHEFEFTSPDEGNIVRVLADTTCTLGEVDHLVADTWDWTGQVCCPMACCVG